MSRTLVAGLLALLAITCAIHVAYALPNPNPNPSPNPNLNPNPNQNSINPTNPNPNPINPSPPHANIILSIMKKFKNGHTVLTFVIKNAGNAVAERAELNVSSNFVSFSSFLGDIHPGESKAATVILNQTGKYAFHITVSYFEGLQEFSKKFERIIYSGNKNKSGIYGMNENKSKTGKTGKMSETKDKVVINLRSDVTEVKVGQEFSLTLSVVNLIGNPNMTLQVVLQPPSGMSIVSSEFAQTGVGQYTGVFHVKPGGAKAIKIDVVSNNPGNFTINGVIAYYFGKDKKNTTVRDVRIPIRVVSEKTRKTPGFELIVSLLVLILVIWRRHR